MRYGDPLMVQMHFSLSPMRKRHYWIRVGQTIWLIPVPRSHIQVSILYPNAYPIVHKDFRRVLLTPFPYAAYFRLHESELIYVVDFHCARNPVVLKTL